MSQSDAARLHCVVCKSRRKILGQVESFWCWAYALVPQFPMQLAGGLDRLGDWIAAGLQTLESTAFQGSRRVCVR